MKNKYFIKVIKSSYFRTAQKIACLFLNFYFFYRKLKRLHVDRLILIVSCSGCFLGLIACYSTELQFTFVLVLVYVLMWLSCKVSPMHEYWVLEVEGCFFVLLLSLVETGQNCPNLHIPLCLICFVFLLSDWLNPRRTYYSYSYYL